MIFFSGAIFAVAVLVLPWWSVWIASLLVGYFVPGNLETSRFVRAVQVGLGATFASMVVAYWRDGISYGMVTQRMSGLLSLPNPYLLILIVGVLAFVTSVLGFLVGASLTKR